MQFAQLNEAVVALFAPVLARAGGREGCDYNPITNLSVGQVDQVAKLSRCRLSSVEVQEGVEVEGLLISGSSKVMKRRRVNGKWMFSWEARELKGHRQM